MIEKYIETIQNSDYKALAACFDDKCKYFDYCAATPYHIYGRAAIEMFFRNQFAFLQFKIYDFVIENDKCANFMVAYNGKYVHARAKIEEVSDEGLISKMIVRVA